MEATAGLVGARGSRPTQRRRGIDLAAFTTADNRSPAWRTASGFDATMLDEKAEIILRLRHQGCDCWSRQPAVWLIAPEDEHKLAQKIWRQNRC
jgi:hypothetical protein